MKNKIQNPLQNNNAAPAGQTTDAQPRFFACLGTALLIGIAAFILYAATVARGALWQDSGMFHMRVFLNDPLGRLGLALSHPLYIHLAHTFAAVIRCGDYAWRVNLFSALAAAVTVANIFLAVAWLTGRRAPALFAAASLALAHTFWARAVIAEVLTLYTALLSIELLCLIAYAKKQNPRWLYALFFLNGLALTDHNFALLPLFCYALMIAYCLTKKLIRFPHVLIMAMCWLIGALPFEILIARQLHAGQPLIDVIRSALFGNNFQDAVLNVNIPYARVPLYILLNFPTPTLLLIIPGLWYLWKGSPFAAVPQNPQLHGGGAPADPAKIVSRTMLAMLAIFYIFAVRYRVPDQYEFFIVAYVMTALAMGLAAHQLFANRPKYLAVALCCTLLPVLCYAAAPILLQKKQVAIPGLKRTIPFRNELFYFLQPWKHNDHSVDQFVRDIQTHIPTGSIIIADNTTFYPLLYYQQAKNQLTDYAIYEPAQKISGDDDIVFAHRVSRDNCGPDWLDSKNLDSLIADRGIYVVTPHLGYCPPWLLDHYRFEQTASLYRVLPKP